MVFAGLGNTEEGPSEFQRATGWLWDLQGPDGSYPEAWRPEGRELVLSKPGWSALSNPAFASYLAESRLANVVVMGAMLEYGISQTCLELSDRGRRQPGRLRRGGGADQGRPGLCERQHRARSDKAPHHR